jgi:hypothetical protein
MSSPYVNVKRMLARFETATRRHEKLTKEVARAAPEHARKVRDEHKQSREALLTYVRRLCAQLPQESATNESQGAKNNASA